MLPGATPAGDPFVQTRVVSILFHEPKDTAELAEQIELTLRDELGDVADQAEVVLTNHLTGVFRSRTDPGVADHTIEFGVGGLSFLNRDGQTVMALSESALPPQVSDQAGDFLVRHECQHVRALLRGEELRSTVKRRQIPAQSISGVYVGLAASVIDEFRAERAVVGHCGPHPDSGTRTRVLHYLELLSGADTSQAIYDAWWRSIEACAYLAGERRSTGDTEVIAAESPWVADLLVRLQDELSDVPAPTEPFGLAEQDAFIDQIAAWLPDTLASVGAKLAEHDGGVELVEL